MHIRQPNKSRFTTPEGQALALLLATLLSLILIVPGLLAGGAYYYFTSHNLIAPWVSFQGIALGGLTPLQAAEKINQAWNVDRRIVATDGSRRWSASPGFFGLKLDPAATVQQAYDIGRGPDSLDEWGRLIYTRHADIQPVVRFDPQVAREQLARWSVLTGQPAQDASLALQGEAVVVTPGQPGQTIDIGKTIAGYSADPWKTLASGEIQIFFTAVPPQVDDVSGAAAALQQLLDQPLKLTLYDAITGEQIEFQVPRRVQAGWIRLEQDAQGYHSSLDAGQLAGYLASLAQDPSPLALGPGRTLPDIGDPQVLAGQMLQGAAPVLIVRHMPSEYTSQAGETLFTIGWKQGIQLWRMLKANPSLGSGALAAGQKVIVPSPDDLLPLPVVLNKRIVVSITEQRMWVYEDGAQIREFVISTGIARSPTQPGVYQVQTHELNAYAANWDLWMPHWLGIYEAWPGFMNGIHGLPLLSNQVRLWKNVLGQPASYGCIILDLPEAEWLYGWAENGVVVEIQK